MTRDSGFLLLLDASWDQRKSGAKLQPIFLVSPVRDVRRSDRKAGVEDAALRPGHLILAA